MKVLSLFDGIACGKVALERAGIPIEKYYASESDKHAINIAMKNHPDIIQIGDVTKVDFNSFGGGADRYAYCWKSLPRLQLCRKAA